jgi:hypothetical protein
MGSTDYGTQTILFKYKQPLVASELNKWFYNILNAGVYDGGALTISSGNIVSIAPIHVIVTTSTNESVHISTADSVLLTISESTPYITCQFSWADSTTNYMDFTAKALGSITTNDIVIGKGEYVTSVLTSFDYSTKTWGKSTSNTFTPVIKGSTSTGVGTYTTQKGRYTKTNSDVNFGINIDMTSHTGSGNIIVGSLPFICGSGINYPCNINASNLSFSGTQISAYVQQGTTDILLKQIFSGSPETEIAMDTNFSLSLSGYYSTENS